MKQMLKIIIFLFIILQLQGCNSTIINFKDKKILHKKQLDYYCTEISDTKTVKVDPSYDYLNAIRKIGKINKNTLFYVTTDFLSDRKNIMHYIYAYDLDTRISKELSIIFTDKKYTIAGIRIIQNKAYYILEYFQKGEDDNELFQELHSFNLSEKMDKILYRLEEKSNFININSTADYLICNYKTNDKVNSLTFKISQETERTSHSGYMYNLNSDTLDAIISKEDRIYKYNIVTQTEQLLEPINSQNILNILWLDEDSLLIQEEEAKVDYMANLLFSPSIFSNKHHYYIYHYSIYDLNKKTVKNIRLPSPFTSFSRILEVW